TVRARGGRRRQCGATPASGREGLGDRRQDHQRESSACIRSRSHPRAFDVAIQARRRQVRSRSRSHLPIGIEPTSLLGRETKWPPRKAAIFLQARNLPRDRTSALSCPRSTRVPFSRPQLTVGASVCLSLLSPRTPARSTPRRRTE